MWIPFQGLTAGEQGLGECRFVLRASGGRVSALTGHVIAGLLALRLTGGQALRLLRQRLLVGAGEEQVCVFVADLELGGDLELQRLPRGVGRCLFGYGETIGGFLRLGLLRFLDLR
jgi:hypothetical protein